MMKQRLELNILLLACLRPCQVLSFTPPSIRHQANSQLKAETDSNNESGGCPFSMAFPQNRRIELTREKENQNAQSSWLVGPFQSALRKNSLQSKFSDDDFVWLGDQDGIHAFASLWRYARDVSLGGTSGKTRAVLGLPSCDSRVLKNWCELIEWISLELPDQGNVKATLYENDAIIIEKNFEAEPSAQQQSDDQNSSPALAEQRLKAWVKRLLVELKICPFTKSVNKSGQGLGDVGVPVGNIAYHFSDGRNIYELMADTWTAIEDMLDQGPGGKNGVSSILLAAPSYDSDFSKWAGPVFSLLEQGVVAARLEASIGVVCFHPQYQVPDGTTWPGFGHMHSVKRLQGWVQEDKRSRSQKKKDAEEGIECPVQALSETDVAAGGAWQRRTPHATINVLRADQLAQAESRRNTPELYKRNIEVLHEIGSEQLAKELEEERGMVM